MCTPALAFAGLAAAASIGGTVVSYTTANAQARAQEQYQKYIYEQNKQVASQSLISEYEATLSRQNEEQRKASQEIFEIVRQSQEAAARAYTGSLESGAAGLSVQNMLGEITRRESEFVLRTQEQQRINMLQLNRENQAASSRYINRVIGATPGPVARPSPIAAGLSIVGAAGNLFSSEVTSNGTSTTYWDAVFGG